MTAVTHMDNANSHEGIHRSRLEDLLPRPRGRPRLRHAKSRNRRVQSAYI